MALSLVEPGRRVSLRELERWTSLAAASAVIAYGFSRRSANGVWLAVAAAPIAYKGIVGTWPFNATDDTRAALGGGKGIHVRDSIRLELPVARVYRFWRTLENLPRFLTHLERVTEHSEGRSHWVAKGPAGVSVEWDAEIINEVENKVIGWRSLPGSDVVTAGSVNFSSIRGGRGTQLSVHLQYSPPAGRAGSWLATMFGREPSQTIREDLRHVKHWLEAGEVPRAYPEAEELGR